MVHIDDPRTVADGIGADLGLHRLGYIGSDGEGHPLPTGTPNPVA